MSSSSILTLIFLRSLIILWNFVSCSIKDLFSIIQNEQSCCFRHNLWGKDLVIYNDSSFVHIASVVCSLSTSFRTLSKRHKIMELIALSTIWVFRACVSAAGINASVFKAPIHFYWIKIGCIFIFHNPKLFFLEIFAISHLAMILTCKQYPFAHWWVPLVVIMASFNFNQHIDM